jgi:hypothetical protein
MPKLAKFLCASLLTTLLFACGSGAGSNDSTVAADTVDTYVPAGETPDAASPLSAETRRLNASEAKAWAQSPPFNAADSDPEAIALADAVIEAMGGMEAYDRARYFHWNFFGKRKLIWDKNGGRVRIDYLDEPTTMLLNLKTMSGRVLQDGYEVTDTTTLNGLLKRARSIWINDSYWLVHPFKLKDGGVTLKYIGPATTSDGQPADVIEQTFEAVGDTPQNKYRLFIDPETKMVLQWDFYANATDEQPAISLPFQDYREYAGILLSGKRGERELTPIQVTATVPPGTFTEFVNPAEEETVQ